MNISSTVILESQIFLKNEYMSTNFYPYVYGEYRLEKGHTEIQK